MHVPLVPTKQAPTALLPQPHAGSNTPAPSGISAGASSNPQYDEQLGMTFTQSFTSMLYNITAIEQTDSSSGVGPGYFLNGLTDAGYWYQVSVSYNWPYTNGGYASGFHMGFEVYNSSGDSVFPSAGGGGLLTFSGPVNDGDTVTLNLYLTNSSSVTMLAVDQNTGASASESYSAEGATEFVGLPSSPGNSNGFFTGLMTEWYHPSPYYGDEQSVSYSSSIALSSAWMWIDEYSPPCCSNEQFSASTPSPVSYTSDPTLLQPFTSNGATEYSDAYQFVTGTTASQISFTLSYAVQGDGAGYSAPIFTYVSNGVTRTATLGTSPTVFEVDPGTSWSVTNPLAGSNPTERWETGQTTHGTASSSQTIDFVYYDQYLATVSFNVADGGSSYTAPVFSCTKLGVRSTFNVTTAPANIWVESGCHYSFTNPLPGSGPSERWESSNATGTILKAINLDPHYYNQFIQTLSYSVIGGGSPSATRFNGTAFGVTTEVTLSSSPSSVWLDSGSMLNVPNLLPPSDNHERWVINLTLPIVTNSANSENLQYQHQYFVEIESATAGGGTVSPASQWADSGSSITLSASPSSGWKFNVWNGTGSSSYSGKSNTPGMAVNGPVNETAVFYPGLTLSVAAGGSVTYSYGAIVGHVSSGDHVIYVPPGTNITLDASPSSFLYSFGGWSISRISSKPLIGVVVNAPTSSVASFSYNLLTIGVLVAVLIAIVGVVVLYRSRSARKNTRESRLPSSSGDQDLDDWVIPHRSISRRTIAAIIGIVAVLIIGSLVVLFPSTFLPGSGPAPVWHPFGGVFSSSGELASEDCSLGNLQPILGGTNAQKLTPQSTVSCSYVGQNYQGVIGTDCNLTPTGPIPSINGTQIPYDGCVLSYAPLNYIFSGLFNLTAKATSASLTVYSNQAVLANITTTAAWKNYHCSMTSDNRTRTNGPMSCYYLGVPYSAAAGVVTVCEFRTPIQVNGVAIPQGACMLQRSETVAGSLTP